MRVTQPEPVTRVYCDECGKEAKTPYYGIGERTIGNCCGHVFDAKVKHDRIVHQIEEQPFFGKPIG